VNRRVLRRSACWLVSAGLLAVSVGSLPLWLSVTWGAGLLVSAVLDGCRRGSALSLVGVAAVLFIWAAWAWRFRDLVCYPAFLSGCVALLGAATVGAMGDAS
jgi:hypothetical protein